MRSKYFNHTVFSELNNLKELVQLPFDFIEFFKFQTGDLSIISLKPNEIKGIGLGFEIENRVCMFGGFLSFIELKQEIEFNLQSTGLLKFANSEMNEGGYFIGVDNTNAGKIFYYENYVEWASDKEILLLSNSFKDFIEKLKPVGLVYNDSAVEYKFLFEELDSKGNLINLSFEPFA
jgi:hypothetical protein